MIDLPKIKALIVKINTQTKNRVYSVSDNHELDMLFSEHGEELVLLAEKATAYETVLRKYAYTDLEDEGRLAVNAIESPR